MAQSLLSRVVRRRLASALRERPVPSSSRQCVQQQRRWITPAPKPGDGPLMSRRADRELPDIEQVTFRWRRTMPIFLAIVAASSIAIFNYQKSSSPVISSTLYALRTSPRARAVLGDDIYFKHQIPWIRGELNQVKGRIDIHFPVRGTRGTAEMRFSSRRPTHRGLFETSEWSLTTEDGQWVDLLEEGDPFKVLLANEDGDDDYLPAAAPPAMVPAAAAATAAADDAATRGFRQQGNYSR